MRDWFIAFLLTVISAGIVQADERDRDLISRCGGPFQLCGYVEKGGGPQRIDARFEVARPFSGGLAAVRIDGRYGYIDRSGRIVIAPRFQAAGPFTGDYAEVRLENASGIVDRLGRLVVPATFERIIPFHAGTFIAEPLLTGQPPREATDYRLEGFDDLSPFVSMRGAGLYDLRRGWLTAQDLTFSKFDRAERGLVWAGQRNADGDEEWGLLQSDGAWRVSPRFAHVQQLEETHAVVNAVMDRTLPPRERRDSIRWGAVDLDGALIVPLRFDYLSYWRGGYGYTRVGRHSGPEGAPDNPQEGIVRADGSLLAGRYFEDVEFGPDGQLPRGRIGGRWHSIDPNGRVLPDQLEGTPLVECPGGLTIIHRGEQVEFLRPGDRQSVGRFDKGYFQARDCPSGYAAKRGGKWFMILPDGAVLGGDEGFDNLYGFNGQHAAVQVDGKWGIIDRSGAFTVAPRFPTLRPERESIFMVGLGDQLHWINANGERVERPAVERTPPEQALSCRGGLRFVESGGLWGLQDEQGRTIIEPRYRALSCFEQGVSWTARPGGSSWCAIGPDGSERDALACRQTYYPVMVSHSAPEEFAEDPYESSVLWSRAWLDYAAGNRAEPPRWISRWAPRGP